MLNVFRTSLRTGLVTTHYPDRSDPPPDAYRGRPAVDPARCTGDGACVRACPSAAITLTPAGEPGRRWQLDLARCLFCGLCAEACPQQAIAMTPDFELAVRHRRDLVTRLRLDGPPEAVSVLAPALADPAPGWDRLTARIRQLLRRSLHLRHVDAGSDNGVDWELSALLGPVYDLQRLGIDVVASPRHADALFVTGAVTRNLADALRRTYEAMPRPGLVIAAGDEACGGGIWQGSYAVAGGVDRVLAVDVYIPGSPPRPQALIHGLLVALDRLEPRLRASDLAGGPAAG